MLRGGGYLVLAQDPATLQARYGIKALGPYDGGLSSDGDTVTLEDAAGQRISQVSYRAEFPWPIDPDGEGASLALVNPALDPSLGGSWRGELPPSPDALNRVFTTNAPPQIRQVRHIPDRPTSTDPVVITAKITDPDGVAQARLQYQLVAAGSYLPAVLPVAVSQLIANPALQPTPNPAYTNAANWLEVPMVDTGTGGDAEAGDGIYTAVLPRQSNRTLVRYRILMSDWLGADPSCSI